MILNLEIEAIKSGLGGKKTGAELTLADTQRPRCLVPFSYYIFDVPAFEEENGKKLADLRFKGVNIAVTSMEPSKIGSAIKLSGELALALDKGANAK